MKRSGVLLAGAAIAVAIGVFFVWSSIPPASNTTTFTIPSGNYFYRFETTSLLDAEVTGSFDVTSGDDVTVMLFDQTEYKSYETTGLASPLFSSSGSTGTFSGSLSGVGKLFIVFEHEAMSGSGETSVQIDYKVSGIAITYLALGIALVVIGVVVAVIGSRIRRKEVEATPPSPAATDVTILSPPEAPKS